MCGQLRRTEGPEGWLSTVVLAGGLLSAGALLIWVNTLLGLGAIEDYGTEAAAARALAALSWDGTTTLVAPFALLIGATAAAILRDRTLPVWLGWFSLLAVIPFVIPSVSWMGLFVLALWIPIMSVVLLWTTATGANRTVAITTAAPGLA
jgi:hypothetical protein